MNQSRTMSAVEAVACAVSGLLVGFLLNLYMLPLFGFRTTTSQAAWLTVLFVAAGMVRSYIVRRIFNLWR